MTACNYPSKRPDIRFEYSKITSKEGNIHLDFRTSLLKYARKKENTSLLLLGLLLISH